MNELPKVSKALAGIVVAVITKYFVDHDILIDNAAVSELVNYVIAAAIGFVTVYLAPKNKV